MIKIVSVAGDPIVHDYANISTATAAAPQAGLTTKDILSAWEKMNTAVPDDFHVDMIVVTILAPPDGAFKVEHEGKKYILMSPRTLDIVKKLSVKSPLTDFMSMMVSIPIVEDEALARNIFKSVFDRFWKKPEPIAYEDSPDGK